jgi:hypothetical protein
MIDPKIIPTDCIEAACAAAFTEERSILGRAVSVVLGVGVEDAVREIDGV